MGYSPWGRKESDMTEQLHFHFFIAGWSDAWYQPRLSLSVSSIWGGDSLAGLSP